MTDKASTKNEKGDGEVTTRRLDERSLSQRQDLPVHGQASVRRIASPLVHESVVGRSEWQHV